MIDHTVSKFFETLFWIGALLIFASFFYSRWFMVTIIVGIALMVTAVAREGFRLRRAKTFTGIIKKNEPKVAHRFILFIGVIVVFVYMLFRQTLVYNLMIQLYDLIKSPTIITWWVFVLIGIIIGLFILFLIIKIGELEYRKLLGRIKLKKEMKGKKEAAVMKKVTVKTKLSFFKKILLEEESFWKRIITPLLKKLEKRRAKKSEDEKTRIEQIRKKKIEALQKKAKEEKILIKDELKKHPLMPRLFILLFILAITTIIILHKRGKFSIEDPLSAAILGLTIGIFIFYIAINIHKIRRDKKTKEEKQEKTVLAKIKKEVIAKASKYETDIDKLYKLIEEVGSLTISEVAEGFGITKEQAEEWGKILEDHDMIELNYPAIGELQLCKKKSKITE